MVKQMRYDERAAVKKSLRKSGASGAERSNSPQSRWHRSAQLRRASGLAPITLPVLKFMQGDI